METIRNVLLLAAFLLIAACCSAQIEGRQVAYAGGTSTRVAVDTVGSFDLERGDALVFLTQTSSNAIVMPYGSITEVKYRRQLARHLGVVAGVTVSLIRKRERKHFFDITFKDAQGVMQTASFEVAKTEPQVIAAVLRARAPQACKDKDACVADDPGILG